MQITGFCIQETNKQANKQTGNQQSMKRISRGCCILETFFDMMKHFGLPEMFGRNLRILEIRQNKIE